MDDGRLPVEMTLEDLAKRLEVFQTDVKAGFQRVDEQLNAARIRDEEMHSLLKFSFEAREGLRESMENRFDAIERKHDDEIGLLKDVLRHVTGPRASR